MKQGWAFAWRSLMAAEIFVTILTGFGLGHLLHYGRELSAMDQVIGVMLVIVIIGLAVDKTLFAPVNDFSIAVGNRAAVDSPTKGGAGHGTDVRARCYGGAVRHAERQRRNQDFSAH
jgi:hypothetical protein